MVVFVALGFCCGIFCWRIYQGDLFFSALLFVLRWSSRILVYLYNPYNIVDTWWYKFGVPPRVFHIFHLILDDLQRLWCTKIVFRVTSLCGRVNSNDRFFWQKIFFVKIVKGEIFQHFLSPGHLQVAKSESVGVSLSSFYACWWGRRKVFDIRNSVLQKEICASSGEGTSPYWWHRFVVHSGVANGSIWVRNILKRWLLWFQSHQAETHPEFPFLRGRSHDQKPRSVCCLFHFAGTIKAFQSKVKASPQRILRSFNIYQGLMLN